MLLQWEDGSKTWEPLNLIAKDDPVTLAKYARENNLLETPGWKFLQRIVRRAKVLKRMLNQVRLKLKKAVRYKFGVRIPRTVKEAIEIDNENGNTLWQDAIAMELLQLFEYKTFHSIGIGVKPPDGYQLICCHIIFDMKQSGQRKARFVARGHTTEPPKDSVYLVCT